MLETSYGNHSPHKQSIALPTVPVESPPKSVLLDMANLYVSVTNSGHFKLEGLLSLNMSVLESPDLRANV
jgi:hypothetical protein